LNLVRWVDSIHWC